MKHILASVFTAFIFGFLFFACNSGGDELSGDYDTTQNGLKYVIHKTNPEEPVPEMGELITMKMTYGSKDSVFFNTNVLPDGTTTLPLVESQYKGDIYEGLAMLHLGDSATFVVQADSFFLKTANFQEVPPYGQNIGSMIINIETVKYQSEQQARVELQAKMVQLQLAEDSILQDFVQANYPGNKPTETGLIYDQVRLGYGKVPVDGNIVTVNFGVELLDGTKIFSTKDNGEPVQFEVGKPFDTKGMDEGVRMMKEGGLAKLIMPSNLAFGERGRANIIPPFTSLICEVELLKVEDVDQFNNSQKEFEKEKIEKYISENNITVQPSSSGLYYIEEVKGTGPKAEPGDKVKVWYTGKLLDGSVFDASSNRNQAFEFTLGTGQVITGWDQGIAMMNQGGKATILIPSNLGYGERGSRDVIPPYAPLIFEVELQEVIKK